MREQDPIKQMQVSDTADKLLAATCGSYCVAIVADAGEDHVMKHGADVAIYCSMSARETIEPTDMVNGLMHLINGMLEPGSELVILGSDGEQVRVNKNERVVLNDQDVEP